LLIDGRPLRRSASLASAAPANPAGTPTTKAGSTSRARISSSAAGALPTSQTAPALTSLNASLTAAALAPMLAVRASRAASESLALQITGYPAMPDATVGASTTTRAPRRTASSPAASAGSKQIRSVA